MAAVAQLEVPDVDLGFGEGLADTALAHAKRESEAGFVREAGVPTDGIYDMNGDGRGDLEIGVCGEHGGDPKSTSRAEAHAGVVRDPTINNAPDVADILCLLSGRPLPFEKAVEPSR